MEYRRYRQDKTEESDATIAKILGEKVPVGFVLEVTHMLVGDKARDDLLLELGYVGLAGVDRVIAADNGSENYDCRLSGRIWIEEGEQPFGRITTPTSGDDLIFSCHGKLWPKK